MLLSSATPAEALARDRLTYLAWGAGLTADQFLARETRLRAHPWCTRGMKTWFWRNSEVLASCETFEMDGYFGFASVFTEERLRGRRYASQLLTAVIERLSAARGFILFSEVGDQIYSRIGFRLLDSREYLFNLPGSAFLDQTPQVQIGDEEAFRRFKHPHWEITPSFEQYSWHWTREKIYRDLMGVQVEPRFVFLRTPTGFSTWMMDHKNQNYRALSFAEPNLEHALQMLEVARVEALRFGARALSVYAAPSNRLLASRFSSSLREDALAMIRGMPADEIHRVHWI